MKKICLLLSCAAVAMSASAFNFTLTGKTLKTELPSRQAKSATDMAAMIAKPLDSSAMRKIGNARKADSSTSIEGTWAFQLGDYYFQTSTGPTQPISKPRLQRKGLYSLRTRRATSFPWWLFMMKTHHPSCSLELCLVR